MVSYRVLKLLTDSLLVPLIIGLVVGGTMGAAFMLLILHRDELTRTHHRIINATFAIGFTVLGYFVFRIIYVFVVAFSS